MNIKGKNFLKLLDLTPEEITGLLDLAADLKAKKKAGGRKIARQSLPKTQKARLKPGGPFGLGVRNRKMDDSKESYMV